MDFFDSYAAGYEFWIERINPPHYPQMLGHFLPHDMSNALDVGCGPGYLSLYLADHAQYVVGLDLSGSMIELAKSKRERFNKDNIYFIVADLHQLPFGGPIFDFIASDCVLHDTQMEVTLPGLLNLLKPGGRIVIRDLVTHKPEKAIIPTWQMMRTMKQVPRYLRQFGVYDTLRLLSFELSPAWVEHKCEGANITPQAFRTKYQQRLPGSKFLDYGWSIAAFWEAPL